MKGEGAVDYWVVYYNHNINHNRNTVHTQIQNTSRLCCFRYERFINFWLQFIVTQGERQFLLCWPHARHILWCLRSQFISASWDLKNGRKFNSMPPWSNLNCLFFKILKFSGLSLPGMTSSTLQPHFLSGGLLWQWWLSYLLHASVKLHPMTMHLNS